MTLPLAALIVYPNDPECDFVAPYDANAVAELKAYLTWSARKWDPDRKCWRIRKTHLADFLDIIDPYFNYFVFDSRLQYSPGAQPFTPKPPPANGVNAQTELYRKLHLSPGAPLEVVKAAYKAMAMRSHPDAGGSHEKMVEVNAAYEAILKEIT